MITLGYGIKKILIWSQMHGNESTATKSLFDFLSLIKTHQQNSKQIATFLNTHTLKIIPLLNPDGAAAYTRTNANGIDLNRDAQELSQKESQALRAVFDQFKPDLCLNMHDQRTIYGLSSGKSATISFLAPAANKTRSITSARKTAMLNIAQIYKALSKEIPGQVGRYDDSFNINCVGDTFTSLEVPTILFEAGHYPEDYAREVTRALIFKALLLVFKISEVENNCSSEEYFSIPENKQTYCDIVLKNARTSPVSKLQNIAIQYAEVLDNGKITFVPAFIEYDTKLIGHIEKNCKGDHIVFNDGKTLQLNEKLQFVYNKTKEREISLRIS